MEPDANNTSAMPVRLDCLPVEVIQRIASYGACESVLTLTRVNKTLCTACNDRQVFRAILRNRNGYGGPRWDNIPLSNDSPTSSWARYALADSKAGELAAKDQRSQTSLPPGFHLWIPQLVLSSREFPHHVSASIGELDDHRRSSTQLRERRKTLHGV